MKFLFAIILVMMIIPFHSCSLRKGMSYNQREKGHFRLYTFPDFQKNKQDPRYSRVVLASINDLNGNITSIEHVFTDPIDKSTTSIEWGGLSALKSYLDILRSKYYGEVLVADSGSFMNPNHFNKKSIFLYNFIGVDIANLGKNEFSLDVKNNISYLKNIIAESNFPIVASNLINLKVNDTPSWKNLHQSYIKIVNGIKIGVIGLFSPEVATNLQQKKLTSLYFQNLPKTIIQTASNLRKKGAHIIITLFNSGIDCTKKLSSALNIAKEKVNFDSYNESICESGDNELFKTLSQLPINTIDAVLSGNIDSKVSNFINKIPVIQSFKNGQYLSWMELYYDNKLHRVATEKTVIKQPVQLCHNFFKDTQDCYAQEKDHRSEIIDAKFLGEKIILNTLP